MATALASVRGSGDTPREIANAVAARRTEESDGETDPGPSSGGEHLEAFVLRMSLTADGGPQRSEVTHVRTMAERVWPGWQPAELAEFIRENAGIRTEPAPTKEPASEEPAPEEPADKAPARRPAPRRRDAPSRQQPSPDQVVVLDAGMTIGGASRDINVVVTNTQSAGGDFGYRATLAARVLGRSQNGEGWATLATHAGTGSPGDDLALEFTGVQLPSGVHRLQLRLEVNLPAPAARSPALALASA